MKKQKITICILTLCTWAFYGNAAPYASYRIPVDVHSDSKISMSYKPLSEEDRLAANQYFRTATGLHTRIWGVSLTYNDNFPTHKDAGRLAERLAVSGINCVRFHHMDKDPWPAGIWDATGSHLHPEAMDRLDYFIDLLAKHGIYSDLTLHVEKKYSEDLNLPKTSIDSDKIINLFTPDLIKAQKNYARELLTHKNPYRNNLMYAEDYAVAFVELTNQNSLFMDYADENLRDLPPYYADILQQQFNRYLLKKYGTTEKMVLSWSQNSKPSSENMIRNSTFSNISNDQSELVDWIVETSANCSVKLKYVGNLKNNNGFNNGYLEIDPIEGGTNVNHLQLKQTGIRILQGKKYILTFKARAPILDRTIHVAIDNELSPDLNLGLDKSVPLRNPLKTYRFDFAVTETCSQAELTFAFGKRSTAFELADIYFGYADEGQLDVTESLENKSVKLFHQREIESQTIDRMLFLAETERSYFQDMKAFIQKALGAKTLVKGTSVFHPLDIYAQENMDFLSTDWKQPAFPEKPQDIVMWTKEQEEMFNSENKTLSRLFSTINRIAKNKPYSVCENDLAKSGIRSDRIPILAAFAASQKLNAVWFQVDMHANDTESLMAADESYKLIPSQWCFIPAGSMIFRKGLLDTSSRTSLLYDKRINVGTLKTIRSGKYSWITEKDHGILYAKSDPVMVFSGNINYFANTTTAFIQDHFQTHGVFVTARDVMPKNVKDSWPPGTPEYIPIIVDANMNINNSGVVSVVVIALDEDALEKSSKILITACGQDKNLNSTHNDPLESGELVNGTITLPASSKYKTSCKILNPDGTVKQTVDCQNNTIPLKAEYGTMWYLVERE